MRVIRLPSNVASCVARVLFSSGTRNQDNTTSEESKQDIFHTMEPKLLKKSTTRLKLRVRY